MNNDVRLIRVLRYSMLAVLVFFAVRTQTGNKISSAPFSSVVQGVTNICTFSTEPSENRMVRRLYGLNVSDYDQVVLYSPTSNMDVYELLIVKLRDVSQSESVVAAMKSRLQTQLDSFEGYGVEQTRLLQDSVLQAEGNYVMFLVHPKATAGLQAFKSCL